MGPADVFREFARRYSHAEHAYANARHTERSAERSEQALSMKQALEAEFGRCFVLTGFPNWESVESCASGEYEAPQR
jgi:hypothetical protein